MTGKDSNVTGQMMDMHWVIIQTSQTSHIREDSTRDGGIGKIAGTTTNRFMKMKMDWTFGWCKRLNVMIRTHRIKHCHIWPLLFQLLALWDTYLTYMTKQILIRRFQRNIHSITCTWSEGVIQTKIQLRRGLLQLRSSPAMFMAVEFPSFFFQKTTNVFRREQRTVFIELLLIGVSKYFARAWLVTIVENFKLIPRE